MNGYFRLAITDRSTNIELFAPTDGGEPVNGQEIVTYLNTFAIRYDPAPLNQALETARTKDATATLCMQPIKPVAAMCDLKVSEDRMKAYLRMISPSNGGNMLEVSDLRAMLEGRGITTGIKDDVLNDMVANPRYCEDILAVEGTYPEESVDGSIEYLFNTDQSQRPTQLEDGSVDFFHLNLLNSCAVGQELAIMHPSHQGKDGYAIDGSIVRARMPKDVRFKYGNNIKVSDDGLKLEATVDGSVALIGDQVFVNDSVSFQEIGPATGNIEYEGSVNISGNIATNYEVKAKGDVVVNGVIEGAYVEAGGNIIVARGVNGMGRATLKAGGCIIAKYLENVQAQAAGYIRAEAIMHSTVSAGGDIIVDGKKGMLSGGKATAGGSIEVKNLGSEMANDTIVEVGVSPIIKRQIMELRNALAEKNKMLEQITPVLTNLAMTVKKGVVLTNEQKVYAAKLMGAQKTANEEIEQITAKLLKLESVCNPDTPSEVRVKGIAYPGSKVCISDVSMAVKTATKYCKFVRLRGDVKITSYE